jgi:APA family basic amino acid/polyamine antiporter
VIVFALAVTSGFEKLAILANLSTLLLYAACCVAAWQLRRRDVRADGIPFRVPAAAVVPWLALAVIAFLLKSITLNEWAVVGGVMAAACALYFVTLPARRRA